LWQSDGTAAGTRLVADLNPGPLASDPSYLINANGTLFFSADDGIHGNELWMLKPALASGSGAAARDFGRSDVAAQTVGQTDNAVPAFLSAGHSHRKIARTNDSVAPHTTATESEETMPLVASHELESEVSNAPIRRVELLHNGKFLISAP